MCVCVCVRGGERERERESLSSLYISRHCQQVKHSLLQGCQSGTMPLKMAPVKKIIVPRVLFCGAKQS